VFHHLREVFHSRKGLNVRLLAFIDSGFKLLEKLISRFLVSKGIFLYSKEKLAQATVGTSSFLAI
jgi:hypothetical protein